MVAYDDTWPEQFAAERDRLVAALGTVAVGIEHVGSTAVPGLAAKPWIDIQLDVPRLEQFDAYAPALIALGYQHHHDDDDHEFFDRRPYHVHVCQAMFDDVEQYAQAKTPFTQRVQPPEADWPR